MKAISYRQDRGDMYISVRFGDGTEREVHVSAHDLTGLLQVVMCALVNGGDQQQISDASKIVSAWLP